MKTCIDKIDFQQERRAEMEVEIKVMSEQEICPLCGNPLVVTQFVYKLPDDQYAHARCLLDYINNESYPYEDILDYRRDKASTEEIF